MCVDRSIKMGGNVGNRLEVLELEGGWHANDQRRRDGEGAPSSAFEAGLHQL